MRVVEGLIPVKRTVHKKGKTFTQTFYVKPTEDFSLSSSNLIKLLEIPKDEIGKFRQWFRQIKKDKLNRDILKKVFKSYSQGATPSLLVIRDAYKFNTSLLHEYAHKYFGLVTLSVLGRTTREIREKFNLDIIPMFLDEEEKLNLNVVGKDKSGYWTYYFNQILWLYKCEMREKGISVEKQSQIKKECADEVFRSFYPKTVLTKADLGSFIQKYVNEFEKKFPLDRNKITLPDIGEVSTSDVESFFYWVASFTYCAWIRTFYKDYIKGHLPYLPGVIQRILKFVKPIQDPILFRGSKDYTKWKQARVGMSIPVGLASFSKNFGDALFFTEEHYEEWEYGASFKRKPSILPVLVIRNINNSLEGIDFDKIEKSFKEIEAEFKDIVEDNTELGSASYLRDIGYEDEVLLKVPKIKIIDIANRDEFFTKYPDIAKKYINKVPSALEKVRFFIVEPDYD